MARLNISLPDELYETTKRWRGTVNLSQICARALEEELDGVEAHRSMDGLLVSLRPPSDIEHAVAEQWSLTECVVIPTPSDRHHLHQQLGRAAASFVDQRVCDDALFAIAGGRQMWGVVKNLSPRNVRVTLTALGIRSNDPGLLHVHPNALTTFLWLLYAPGASAHLVSATRFASLWSSQLPPKPRPSYFVLASCSPFEPTSPFGALVGRDGAVDLTERGAYGDFAYVFFQQDGLLLDPPESRIAPTHGLDHSLFAADYLRDLSGRSDARVALVAGGERKHRLISFVLRSRLCNTLVTDTDTARYLLEKVG